MARLWAGVAMAIVFCTAQVANAQTDEPVPARWGEPLEWQWKEFSETNYWILGVSGATAIASQIVAPVSQRRQGGVWIDEDVRDALLPSTLGKQLFARDASDVLLTFGTALPFFDSIVVAGWYRQSPEVAEQMAFITAETMAVNAAVVGLVKFLAARERPFGRTCGGELPETTDDCDNFDRYRSFMSGHAAQTFASAALVCTHHYHVDLYQFASSALPCAGSFAVAGATGLLRVAADKHYITDVMVGAATGATIGALVPWLLHYRWRTTSVTDMRLVPSPNGLNLMGTF